MANPFQDIIDDVTGRVDNRLNTLLQGLNAYIERIEEVTGRIEAAVAEEQYARDSGAVTVDATGVTTIELGASQGTAWMLTNIATTCSAAATCNVYIDGPQPHNLIQVISAAQAFSANGIDLYIPQGRTVVFQFTAVAGTNCAVSVQVKYLQETPS